MTKQGKIRKGMVMMGKKAGKQKGVCPVSCVLYKSVGGIYTADPKIVPEARLIPEISYEELMEMGSQGSKVVNPVAVEWAMLYGVELFITSMEGSSGTMIA